MLNLRLFTEWAHFNLLENDAARNYLFSRGVSEEQIIRHRFGYISNPYNVDFKDDVNHNDLCKSDKKVKWCDSCRFIYWSKDRDYNICGRLVNNIVFPLNSYSGATVGIQTCSLTEKAYDTFAIKYRPEGYLFGASANLDKIWSNHEIWITEGIFDQLVTERLVASNTVALTTSSITSLQVRFLRRFVSDVVLVLDNDKAGIDGSNQFIKYNDKYFNITKVKLPNVKDPNDFWKTVGDQKFKQFFEKEVLWKKKSL